jgi:hypothetical protein
VGHAGPQLAHGGQLGGLDELLLRLRELAHLIAEIRVQPGVLECDPRLPHQQLEQLDLARMKLLPRDLLAEQEHARQLALGEEGQCQGHACRLEPAHHVMVRVPVVLRPLLGLQRLAGQPQPVGDGIVDVGEGRILGLAG